MNELKTNFSPDKYFKVDNILIDLFAKELGVNALAIYIALKRHANKNGVAWPTVEYLAKELGTSTRTIKRYARRLEEHQLLYRVKRKHEGAWGHYTYYLMPRDDWKSSDKSELLVDK
jgi:predicted transcriptional regulator